MVDRYVDKAATGPGDGTIGDPWTTLEAAEAGSITNDVIHVETGVYPESDPTFNAVNSVKGLDWIAENGPVTVTSTSTSFVIINAGADAKSWTGFTFDGESNTGLVIRSNTAGSNLTITGGSLINPAAAGGHIYSTENSPTDNVIIDGPIVSGTSNSMAFDLSSQDNFILRNADISGTWSRILLAIGTNNLTVEDITADYTESLNSSIYSNNVSGQTRFSRNNITQTSTIQNTAVMLVNRSPDALVEGNTIDSRGVTTAHASIAVEATSAGAYNNPIVRNNTLLNNTATGIVLRVGTDSPTIGDNSLDGALIEHNNILTAGLISVHGIELGHNLGTVIRNRVDGAVYGIVHKGVDSFTSIYPFCGNTVLRSLLYSIFIKGTKDVFCTNQTIFNNTTTNPHILVAINTEAGDSPATGAKIYNSIIVNDQVSTGNMISVDTPSSTGFDADGNLYYTPNGNTVFDVAGTTYANLTDWNAFISGTDSEGDPLFVDAANGNYELQAGSAAIGIGVKWWGNEPRPVGENGEPYPDLQIDAGSHQSLHSINHPGNPNFVPL